MLIIFKKIHIILLPLLLVSCSNTPQRTHNSGANKEFGKASYYADKYQNRQTASGELFNQKKATAAHKTLRFGTWLRVTNVDNGRSVIVRINDRGPFMKGRIIDLSKSAFSAIGNTRLGVIDVIVEVIK